MPVPYKRDEASLLSEAYLYADGSDDTNLITIVSADILGDGDIFRISGIKFGLAACRDDRLGGQVDDVRKTPKRKY